MIGKTPRFSSDVVNSLRCNGKTLKEIGKLIGRSESFISLVANGKRNFTIDDLIALEKALDTPLPLLILEALGDSVSKNMKSQYKSLRGIFESSRKLRDSLSE